MLVLFGWWLLFLSNFIPSDSRSEQALTSYSFSMQQSRKQFRLSGHTYIVDYNESDAFLIQARLDLWRDISESARLQFRYPAPGEQRKQIQSGHPDPFRPNQPSAEVPEEPFALLLMRPTKVDMVDLYANERSLFVLDENRQWSESSLNP